MTAPAPRTAFVSRSRQAGLGLVEQRRQWLVFIAGARANALLAAERRGTSSDERRGLAHLAARLKAPFPVRRAAAVAAAEAALVLAGGLVDAELAADRLDLAEPLLSTLRFLDRVLHDDAVDASALSRRISGDVPDDAD
jgi:hypothetical protein